MENRLPRIAITQGDTNGIGFELIFKALEDPTILELCTPIIYGSPKVAAYHCKALNIQSNFSIINNAEDIVDGRINLMATTDEDIKVELGIANELAGEAGLQAIDKALEDYQAGVFDALVTAPLENNKVFQFSGQGRYIADHIDSYNNEFTMLVSDSLRIALATRYLPLKQVVENITKEAITNKLKNLSKSLQRDFRISNPRVALLSLNPKAGENGLLGTEEQEILTPAINKLNENDVHVFGPYATDSFFGSEDWQAFDGILALYYDQGVTPFKYLNDNERACFTAGLPLVHTFPITNGCLELAGKNEADACSLRYSIFLAIDLFRNRIEYDTPMENPLKKLYKEKREENDRTRFSIPKKREDRMPKKKE